VRLKFVLAFSAASMLLVSQAQAVSVTKVRFNESTDGTMYGVHSAWDDPLTSQAISCPNNDFQINFIDVFVRGNGTTGSEYIEGGVRYQKQHFGGSCSGGSRQVHYSEWDIGSGTSGYVSTDEIDDGNHDYALNQLSSGDWYFRVDGGSTFEVSLWDSGDIPFFEVVRLGGLCHRENGATGSDCDSTGKVNPANDLTYKPSNSYSGASTTPRRLVESGTAPRVCSWDST
jgi:hypothetical protein